MINRLYFYSGMVVNNDTKKPGPSSYFSGVVSVRSLFANPQKAKELINNKLADKPLKNTADSDYNAIRRPRPIGHRVLTAFNRVN